MYLNKADIVRIQGILDKFPDVDRFELNADSSSGIGTTVTMSFEHVVNSVDAKINIEISGVENW